MSKPGNHLKSHDLAGQKFGRLFVITRKGVDKNRNVLWVAQCECMKIRLVRATALVGGHIKSCGCLQIETNIARNMTNASHGHTIFGRQSRTYSSWVAMHTRCSNVKHEAYYRYGGRGITVCERWKDFENFLLDMGERPQGRTLDRIENDEGYSKSNCRWATPKQQTDNRR